MLDERFAVVDWDLDDDSLIAGTCIECGRYERLLRFLNAVRRTAQQKDIMHKHTFFLDDGYARCEYPFCKYVFTPTEITMILNDIANGEAAQQMRGADSSYADEVLHHEMFLDGAGYEGE